MQDLKSRPNKMQFNYLKREKVNNLFPKMENLWTQRMEQYNFPQMKI